MQIKTSILGALLFSQSLLGSAYAAESCQRFSECIQKTLASQNDIDKILYSTRALKLWDKSVPQRDLLNVLKLHAEALLKVQAMGTTPDDLDLLSQAESDYQRFLSLEPGNWLPLAGLAKIAEMRGQIQPAENYFREAVKAHKIPAYVQRASFYERQSNYALALADLNQAIELEKHLAKRDLGLSKAQLAQIYQQRAKVHAQLKHALDEMLDLDTACKLGFQESCKR